MEPELSALAASGATALVGLMVTDAWSGVREHLRGLLATGGDAAAAELDTARAELLMARETGDEAAAADVEALWRVRRDITG